MTIVEATRKALRNLMNDFADDLTTGSASDFSEYRHQVGRIEGLALAERIFLDILEKMDIEED